MRTLAPTILAVVLGTALGAACAPVTDRVDDLTGTTVDERCTRYRAVIAEHERRVEAEEEVLVTEGSISNARLAVALYCTLPAPGAE